MVGGWRLRSWNAEAELGMNGKADGLPDDTIRVFDVESGPKAG